MQELTLDAWVAEHVALKERLQAVQERPWASVWRASSAIGVVWVKVCAPVQAFEPQLTTALAGRWPALLPEVLAADSERGWLLLTDVGERLGFRGSVEPWLSLLPAYAELQEGEIPYVADHLDAGVPDRGLASFPVLYEEMLRHELPLSVDERACLLSFASTFRRLSEELAGVSLPETIQHDDLHGNNVYPSKGKAKILDWGDACVSHPFLTTFMTFLHLEQMQAPPLTDRWRTRLRDAYLAAWGRPSELRETFDLAQRLGPFAHAFKQLRVLDAIPETQHHFAALREVLSRCVATAA